MFVTPYFPDYFRNFEKYNATNLTQLPSHQEHEPQQPEYKHLSFVHLRSPKITEHWLITLDYQSRTAPQ